jgi:DnaK suppressor protein
VRDYIKQNQDSQDIPGAETLRRLLARHEAELTVRKRLLREDITPEPSGGRDAVESSADTITGDVGAALVEATARTVQGIEDALNRLKTGVYGTCLDCGDRIPALRLQALPFAERCRDCQQQYDPAPRPTTSVWGQPARAATSRPGAGRSANRGSEGPARRLARLQGPLQRRRLA